MVTNRTWNRSQIAVGDQTASSAAPRSARRLEPGNRLSPEAPGRLVRVNRRAGAFVAALVLTCATGCSDGGGSEANPGLVAADDEVTIYGGASSGRLDPLANDSAPDGATLRMCRLPRDRDGRLRYEYYDVAKHLTVTVMPQAKARTHRIEYTACAGGDRATATVLVTVLPRPAVTVTKTSRPGRLRVVNPADVPIEVYFGHPNDELLPPDGHFRVPAGESRVFAVRRDTIDWSASSFPEVPADFRLQGQVAGIRMPPGVEPLPDPGPGGST